MKRPQRTAHARIWLGLAILLPIIFIASLSMRQKTPVDRPAVLIQAPPQ
ncbi:MAG: hypothetical protein AAF228_04395 [Pseudomonadota bacterium]